MTEKEEREKFSKIVLDEDQKQINKCPKVGKSEHTAPIQICSKIWRDR